MIAAARARLQAIEECLAIAQAEVDKLIEAHASAKRNDHRSVASHLSQALRAAENIRNAIKDRRDRG